MSGAELNITGAGIAITCLAVGGLIMMIAASISYYQMQRSESCRQACAELGVSSVSDSSCICNGRTR